MKLLKFLSLFISLFSLSLCASMCIYKFYGKIKSMNPDILLQRVENKFLIMQTNENGNLYIPENAIIDVLCESGFRITDDKFFILQNISIFCNKGHVYFGAFDSAGVEILKHEYLMCNEITSSFYQFKIPYCNYTGFLYGTTIRNKSIIFAEICYDLRKSNFIFIHYVASKRSPYLDEQNQQPGIFLRPFGNDTIIFNPTDSFRIPEEEYVQVYCFSGIENQENDEWGSQLSEDGEKVKNLTVHCNKHKLDYKVADHSKVRANTKIRCGGTNELYNPSKMPFQLYQMQKFIFPNKVQQNSNSKINQINFTTFTGSTLFEIDELVNFAKYSKYLEKFLSDISEVNSVIWWSPLKNGNWKVYERLLEKESLENDYDVFVGKSGIVTYPYDDKFGMTTELLLEFQGTNKTVPLIIWSYIRPRETNTSDEEVVILGVNSPFSEGGIDNVTMICKDMCDTIEWLEPLSRTRKMPVYGYIFCCRPNEVKHILDGFPNFNFVPPQI